MKKKHLMKPNCDFDGWFVIFNAHYYKKMLLFDSRKGKDVAQRQP